MSHPLVLAAMALMQMDEIKRTAATPAHLRSGQAGRIRRNRLHGSGGSAQPTVEQPVDERIPTLV